jgi:NDP-sugar pyrophosphorylase family protein
MMAKETFSVGDAMRDIYTRGLVTSDFVLVMGDLVSNVKIDQVVRAHKERRKKNKDAIMTMVVKESGVRHRTRSVFFFLRKKIEERKNPPLDRVVTRRCLCWTRRRLSACIMNL